MWTHKAAKRNRQAVLGAAGLRGRLACSRWGSRIWGCSGKARGSCRDPLPRALSHRPARFWDASAMIPSAWPLPSCSTPLPLWFFHKGQPFNPVHLWESFLNDRSAFALASSQYASCQERQCLSWPSIKSWKQMRYCNYLRDLRIKSNRNLAATLTAFLKTFIFLIKHKTEEYYNLHSGCSVMVWVLNTYCKLKIQHGPWFKFF